MALGSAWVFLVAGEMVGAQSGLGYLIIDARNSIRPDLVLDSGPKSSDFAFLD